MVIAAVIMLIMKPKESMLTKDRIQGLKCCFSVPCLYLGPQSFYLKQITTEHGKELFYMAQKCIVRSNCMKPRSEKCSKDIK